MKKVFALLLSVLLLLPGCGRTGENPSGKEGLSGEISSQPLDLSSVADQSIDCRILYRMQDSLLMIPEEGGELITLSPRGLALEDQQGQTMEPDQLQPGMCVQVTFDGSVLEIYPCQLSGASAIQVTGTFLNLVPFYLDRLDELYQEDAALNSEIEKIALDLSELGNVSEQEKEALRYLVESRYGIETFFSSFQELCDQGEIDREHPYYYEKGIILQLSSQQETEDDFVLSGRKWRSGLGAIGYTDAQVQWKNGEWTFQEGAWFIS